MEPTKEQKATPGHTPGPWTAETLGTLPDEWNLGDRISAAGVVIAATIESERIDLHAKANARLIAAAPDLLEAAKNLVKFIRTEWPNHPEGDYLHGGALIEIERAITKAGAQ